MKATVTVQLELAASVLPHVLPVMLKSPGSVPANAMLEMETEPEPPLVNVNVLEAAVDPTVCEPHDRPEGLIVTVAVGAGVPVPESGTVCGLLLAPSTKFRVAVRAPVVVGWKSKVT